MSNLKLALRQWRANWRSGEWNILLLAVILAVASLATVGLFIDRISQALQQQASSLIGSDLRISSNRPLSANYQQLAQQYGLKTVTAKNFPSMVVAGEHNLLVEIQAVSNGYPLRGQIQTQPKLANLSMPAAGTIWVEAAVLRRLQLKIGDTLGVGYRQLQVSAVIEQDVDQSVSFLRMAPRVLLNQHDLAATGLVQTGSRMQHRLLVAGNEQQLAAFTTQLKTQLAGHERIESVRDARPEVRTALERAENFLGLAALTAAVLAAAAIALAARRFVQRHLDSCALMRCFGAPQTQVLTLFFYQFMVLGLLACVAGCGLGYLVQFGLSSIFESLYPVELPAPGWLPLIKASSCGLLLLIGFVFLPLLQLGKVSPLRVIRRELGSQPAQLWLAYSLALAIFCVLFLWQAGSVKLGLMMLGGLLGGLLLLAGLLSLILIGLQRLLPLCSPPLRHAVINLVRHRQLTVLQVVALSLGGMALLLLTLIRNDLINSWQAQLPPETPNRFLVNIQDDQQQAVQQFFAQHGLNSPQLFPSVRARLVGINGRPLQTNQYSDQRTRQLAEREFNLSWMAQQPSWNTLLAGRWWRGHEGGQVSIELGLAQRLGVNLGDRLEYDVAGSRFSATISSIREVHWDSMQVNFFVITSPDLLRHQPNSYITSFYLPPQHDTVMDQFVAAFPNVLVINTASVLQQVRTVIDQISLVMSVVFLFTLSSGLLVLYAALLATQDERQRELAILRTLGVKRNWLRQQHGYEFVLLGLLSGLFAASTALGCAWLIAEQIFEIPLANNNTIWLLAIGGGITLVSLAGYWATRPLLRQSPLSILRR